MTENTTDFFDGIGGGSGAPGAVLKNVGDSVNGTIVEMFKRDYVPYENRKTKEPEKRADGTNKQQLVVILQTEHRNWANVSSVPKVDFNDPNSADKDPGEDDGKRAIYVPEGKNIQFAIGRAVTTAQAPFEVGGQLAVRIFNLKDTGQGNPLKEHEAFYKAKAETFFQDAPQAPAQQAAPAPAAAPAAPAPQAPPAPAAPAPQAAPAPATPQDPWGTPAPAGGSEPPF
jgi:hypothetical protein